MSERYIGGLIYNPPGGWSGYFDGVGDYIQITSAAALQFGTGNFTIEFWLNLVGQDTNGAAVFNNYNSFTTGALGFFAGHTSASTTKYEVAVNGTFPAIQSNTAITYNTWNHFAIVRNGNTLTLYINGLADGTYSVSGITLNGVGSYWWLGSAQDAPSNYETNGSISNFRVVKGTAVYTANFTPPTASLLPITNTSLLTCAYSTFRDGSTNNFTITAAGSTVVSTANPFPTTALPNPALGNAGNGIYTLSQYAALRGAGTWPAYDPYYPNVVMNLHSNAGTVLPFNTDASTNNFQVTQVGDTSPSNLTPFIANGYWSNYFNGSTSRMSVATSTAFGFGTGNFTIEFWLYYTGGNGYKFFFVNYSGAGNYIGYGLQSGTLTPWVWNNADVLVASSNITTNTWQHHAVVRNGSTLTIYLNGTSIGSTTWSVDIGSTKPMYIGWNSGDNTQTTQGYISNFRAVKGTAVYTSAFTPPTTPLTAITNTSLLTCQSNRFIDNSTNAFAITVSGSLLVDPFQPFTAPTGTSAYGSGYFDGTGDYLTAPDNAVFDMANGDFTVEFWFNPTQAKNTSLFTKRASNASFSPIMVQWTSGNQLIAYCSTTGSSWGMASTTSATYPLNAWVHVAFVRYSNNLYLYVNGVSAVTAVAITSAVMTNTSAFVIGADDSAGSLGYAGYISNMRVVKGTAVYTSAFTPPTAPLTAVTNTQLLTVQTNAPSQNNTFLDSSTNNFTITRNGNTSQGTFTPYGSNWSGYFDGTGDNLTLSPGAAFAFGTGDFTVECFAYINSFPSNPNSVYFVDARNSGQTGTWTFLTSGDGTSPTRLDWYTGSALITSTTLTANTWLHLVYTRASSTYGMFVNGARVATGTDSTNYSVSPTTSYIASRFSSDNNLNGYMSNLRIVKGSSVYSPSISTLTVPTAPLTAITNTVLLTCQSNRFVDNSTNNFTLTKNGDTSIQRFTPFFSIAPYSASTNGGSGYFDGSGDYLTVPTAPAFNLGTNAFTIECWYYSLGSTSYQAFISAWGTTQSNSAFEIGMNGSNLFIQIAYGGSQVSFQPTLPANYQWNHVVMVSNGSTLSAFLNGARVGTQAFSSSINSASYTPAIGYRVAASNYAFTGYIASPRIVNGSAVYDPTLTTCTVPTAPPSVVTNTSLLLNFTNAATSDNAMMNDLETVGNSQISTSIKKYGSASMYFDGSGDYLSLPNNPALDQSGDYTYECWYYRVATGSGGFDIICLKNVTNMLYLYVDQSNFKVGINQHNVGNFLSGTTVTLVNTWYHLAMCRSGSTVRLFVNGILEASGSYSTNVIGNAGMNIGGFFSGYSMNGYIDDLRITKAARYTANFTPPTSQLQDQ